MGAIQRMHITAFDVLPNPILKWLDTIECRDALLAPDGTEREWLEANVDEPVLGRPKRLVPRGETAARKLQDRTLTNLYDSLPKCLVDHMPISAPRQRQPTDGTWRYQTTRHSEICLPSIRQGSKHD